MRVRINHHRLAEELSKSPSSLNRWAQRLGLSSGHLSDLVNGKRLYPTARTRDKLLDGLGLPFESLFEIETKGKRRRNKEPTLFRDGSLDQPRVSSRRRGGDVLGLARDLRVSLRALVRSPAFSLAALLTLAVGIASNTALFSIVDSILWKPYPYVDSERLVVVHSTLERRGNRQSNLSFPDAMDVREQSDLLDGLAAWDWEPYNLATGEEPRRVGGTRVSAGFFEVLGVSPLVGRAFLPEDDRPGAEPVVILTEGLWKSAFAGNPDVVGTSVSINARTTTVIGVMPRAAEYPDQTALWVPLAFDETIAPRGVNFLGTVGRLKPNVELQSLDTELRSIALRLQEAYPDTNDGRSLGAMTLRQALTGDIQTLSIALLGVVTFVLLIVCANIANLLLSRGVTREREIAVRRAMGASGTRLAQGLLCESVVLATAGGLIGFGLGAVAIDQILRLIEVEIPPWIQVSLDGRVMLYTVGVTTAATILFSLVPVLQALRQSVSGSMEQSGQRFGTALRGRKLRGALVVSEVALSLVLLVGAGLMLQSVMVMSAVEPGFESRGALAVGLDLLAHKDKEPEERALLFESFIERFEAIPGVESVGAINMFPLRRRSNSAGVTAEGQGPEEAEQNLEPQFAAATPGYFQAMGIPLLQGERWDHTLESVGASNVIVSRRLADALWPGVNPIGRRLKLGSFDSEREWMTVKGVVGDIVHHGMDRERAAHLYVPYERQAPTRMTAVIRTAGAVPPEEIAPAIREAARLVDPHQPIHDVASVSSVVDLSMWQWRFFGSLFWWFGGTALVLALIGIYGVMSYTVSQRRREVGLRMALGARERDVVGMVLRQGGSLVLTGVLCGLPLAGVLGAVLAGALFEVQPFEPLMLAGVSILLVVVSLAAVFVPARRAALVDPAATLRTE